MDQEQVLITLTKLSEKMESLFLQMGRLEGRFESEERTRAVQKKEIIESIERTKKEINESIEQLRNKLQSEMYNPSDGVRFLIDRMATQQKMVIGAFVIGVPAFLKLLYDLVKWFITTQ